jgi:hypothetical protein
MIGFHDLLMQKLSSLFTSLTWNAIPNVSPLIRVQISMFGGKDEVMELDVVFKADIVLHHH